jgi:hypothetical protein
MEHQHPSQSIDVPKSIKSFNSSHFAKLISIINTEITKFKNQVHLKHDIPLEELNNIHTTDVATIAMKLGIKKRNRRILCSHEQCMGRKGDGNQCTRSRKDVSEYCLSHQKSIPHGRIDDDTYSRKQKGKPGRRPKNDKYVNDPDYLSVTIRNISGQSYLVDVENNVYTYDFEHPKKIGTFSNNQLILD